MLCAVAMQENGRLHQHMGVNMITHHDVQPPMIQYKFYINIHIYTWLDGGRVRHRIGLKKGTRWQTWIYWRTQRVTKRRWYYLKKTLNHSLCWGILARNGCYCSTRFHHSTSLEFHEIERKHCYHCRYVMGQHLLNRIHLLHPEEVMNLPVDCHHCPAN